MPLISVVRMAKPGKAPMWMTHFAKPRAGYVEDQNVVIDMAVC